MRVWPVVVGFIAAIGVAVAVDFLTSGQFSWTGGADRITNVISVVVTVVATLLSLIGVIAQWRSRPSAGDRWYRAEPNGRDHYAELERQRIASMFSVEQVSALEWMLNERDQLNRELTRRADRRRDLMFLASGAVLGALLGIPASWIADLIAKQF